MASDWSEAQNPYRILQLQNGPRSTPEEIKKAYKRLALVKHPDKNKNNPKANDEFDELKRARDILLDKDARAALDDVIRTQEARDARLAQQDAKRQKLREDLERRERQATSERSELDTAKARLQEELNRLRQKAMEEQRKAVSAAAAAQASHRAAQSAGGDPEIQEALKRTLKVSWDTRDGDYTIQQLREAFSKHGEVEDVVIRDRKKKKHTVSALVVMASIAGAQSAAQSVCGELSHPLLVLPMQKVALDDLDPKDGSKASSSNPQASTTASMPAFAFPSHSMPPHPSMPLFPGGAATAGAPSMRPTAAGSSFMSTAGGSTQGLNFEAWEASILERLKQKGQEQKTGSVATG